MNGITYCIKHLPKGEIHLDQNLVSFVTDMILFFCREC